MDLPDHLTEQEVRRLADECDTIIEFQLESRIRSRNAATRILYHRDLGDEFDGVGDVLMRLQDE